MFECSAIELSVSGSHSKNSPQNPLVGRLGGSWSLSGCGNTLPLPSIEPTPSSPWFNFVSFPKGILNFFALLHAERINVQNGPAPRTRPKSSECCRVQLKYDGTRWRTGGGEWRGNWRMERISSTLHTTSEHGVSSITTADAHTSAASSRLNWRPLLTYLLTY